MRQERIFACIIALLLIALSCGRTPIGNRLQDIYGFIQDHPDSALAVLEGLGEPRDRSGRDFADYRLLMAMALDKNYVDVDSDTLVRPAVEYFSRHGPKDRLMMSLYYLGTAQYYGKDYNHAILNLDEAERLGEETGSLRYQALANMAKSYVFSSVYNHKEALSCAQKGTDYFAQIPDSFQFVRSKHTVGLQYNNLRQYDKARAIYQEVLEDAPEDTFIMRRALLDCAWTEMLRSFDAAGAEKAIELTERAVSEYGAPLTPFYAGHYAEALAMCGRLDEAESILELLDNTPGADMQALFCRFYLQKEKNEYVEALASYEKIVSLQDSIAVQTMEQSLLRTQRDYMAEAAKVSELRARSRAQWIMVVSIIAVLILVVGIMMALYLNKKRLAEREELSGIAAQTSLLLRESESENENLEESLNNARRAYVMAYKEQVSKISKLVDAYYGSDASSSAVTQEVKYLAKSVSADGKVYQRLENSVNLHLDNAMALYRREVPGKGEMHYRIVCYLMAGYPASTIRLLTGVPENTVYSQKRRLLADLAGNPPQHYDLFRLVL